MKDTFLVNDIFYTLQGEGLRSGEASIFVRFSKCNLECSVEPGPKSPGGFDCDTEFESGSRESFDSLLARIQAADEAGRSFGASQSEAPCRWLVLTGGEPGLQIDADTIRAFQAKGFKVQIETNGTVALPDCIDWITVSPKVAEHALKQDVADEVKYVRGYGQAVPKPSIKARGGRELNLLLSPAFVGEDLDRRALVWCVGLVKENPQWRLSTQNHKWWRVR